MQSSTPYLTIKQATQRATMSLFDSSPTLQPDNVQPHPVTFTAIGVFIVISAVGLSVVVGFVLFVWWYRMKKRREQRDAVLQLVELSNIGHSPGPSSREGVGIAR